VVGSRGQNQLTEKVGKLSTCIFIFVILFAERASVDCQHGLQQLKSRWIQQQAGDVLGSKWSHSTSFDRFPSITVSFSAANHT